MIPLAALTQRVVVEHRAPGPRNPAGQRPLVKVGEDPYQAHVEQLSTREETTGRLVLVDAWLLMLPPHARIAASAHVLWQGGRYEVDGSPARPSLLGRPTHVEARLKLVSAVA